MKLDAIAEQNVNAINSFSPLYRHLCLNHNIAGYFMS